MKLPSGNVFVTSDLHIDHENILHYANRPFSSLEEQRTAFLSQINDLPKEATLILVGDIAFKKKIELRGFLNNIRVDIHLIFVLGNHDKELASVYKEYGYTENLLITKYKGYNVSFCHYPMAEWYKGNHGGMLFHGHNHGLLTEKGLTMDIGWDVEKRIFSLDELIIRMYKRTIYQPCHNGNNGMTLLEVSLSNEARDSDLHQLALNNIQ